MIGVMLFFLMCLLAAGAEVSAGGRKQPPGCPFPSGPYVPPDCGPNAYFEVCSYPCPAQNCSTLWTNYKCKEECCKPECRCKDGYLRDDKTGLCVDRDECFAPCGSMECFVRGSTECRKTCANYNINPPQSMCKPFTGCVCKPGRVRLNDDATGACVLPKECPSRSCPLHEHLEKCPSVCVNETCISKTSRDFKCLLPAIPLPCKPRCICDKGYLRNHLGKCVPQNRCPVKQCPINEVWRCAAPCAHDSCKRLEPGFKCPPGVVSVCIPACVCKDGYLRNDRGVCKPRELCPASLKCGINEIAAECAIVSPPQTCESIYTTYAVVDVPCKPGCDCRSGYLRDKHNICIPSEFCPIVPPNQCGPDEDYSECGSACEPSCADLDSPLTPPCTEQCVAGCFCKPGYRRDAQGFCIPQNECPLPVCNQPNEVAKDCGSYCEIRTCEDYKRTDIACPAVCVRGCFCRKGYVRNAYGVCVLPEQCPPEPVCLLDNEEYLSCGSSCPDTCDNYKDTGRICTANCVAGCYCKKGYVRNLRDKTCVKPEQCPTKKCNGVNEQWNNCASYCPVTCANRLTQDDVSCITLCREACDCVPGTLRADNGTCVPVSQCSPPVCREHEKYTKCGTACPVTCDNYKNPPKICTQQCIEDCFCVDGCVRDRNNRCVKPEYCEPVCPTGEKYDQCSAHCQDTCENYNSTNRFCTYQCQSGCVCDTGTVRRKDGQCVPPNECLKPRCPLDEVYDKCSAHCEPTCEHHEPDRPCTDICKPGCRCRDPLVRRSDGKCVPLDECEPSCPDGEKYSPCSAHCQDTCENYNVTNRVCTRQCQPGCVCAAGTVRRKDGQCVPPSQCCDPTCPSDEVYDRCSAHCEPTCKYPDGPPCTKICKAGCRCRKGLVRRDDGNCVAFNECTTKDCGPNEHYEKDRVKCELTCKNYKLESIMGPCWPVSGCFCDIGYVKDSRGVCIKKKQCPKPIICPKNEVLSDCYNTCHMTCKTRLRSDGKVCHLACIDSGCLCVDGYLRHDNGTCVPINQCSPPRCLANETYSACGSACPTTCDNRGNTCIVCTQQCVEDCFCSKGLVRAADGSCVDPKDCPPRPCCGPNEVFEECPSPCPPGDKCSNMWTKYDCAKFPDCCKPQCRCKPGYLRNKKGQCIPSSQCRSGD